MEANGPELRRDRLAGRWVIVAPERLGRPIDFHPVVHAARPSSSRTCPLCPGHEKHTPPESFALRPRRSAPDGPGWRVRAIPNKFPALGREDRGAMGHAGLPFPSLPGIGAHEVVVDTPEHGREWADLPLGQVRAVLEVYRHRMAALGQAVPVRFIQLFKNKGREAGASLSHSHSQIIAMPVVPDDAAREAARAKREMVRTGRCPYCLMIEEEKKAGSRLIALDRHFAAFVPFAARFPYETRIVPLRHAAEFRTASDEELAALAGTALKVLTRMKERLGDPPYNIVLRQAPLVRSAAFHWSLDILPVLTHIAGFELGTGMFINPVRPEASARELRR
jgi:UDPglucose--hexose-1-phosphate uridylyltransferase